MKRQIERMGRKGEEDGERQSERKGKCKRKRRLPATSSPDELGNSLHHGHDRSLRKTFSTSRK